MRGRCGRDAVAGHLLQDPSGTTRELSLLMCIVLLHATTEGSITPGARDSLDVNGWAASEADRDEWKRIADVQDREAAAAAMKSCTVLGAVRRKTT